MDPTIPEYFIALNRATQAAVLLTLSVGLWIGMRRAALSRTEKIETGVPLAGAVLIWFAGASWLGHLRFFVAPTASLPPIAFAIVMPIAAGLALLTWSDRFRAFAWALPQSWLTGVQVYRALGAMFLGLWAQDRLPGEFALPAGIGDVIIGVTAPIVAWLNASRSPSARSATLIWNGFGIADLIVAVGTGFLTSPSPYQALAFDRPNMVMAAQPFVLVPTFFVPLSIILHAMSLWKLRAGEAGSFRVA